MTKNERIAELEAKVAALAARVEALEAERSEPEPEPSWQRTVDEAGAALVPYRAPWARRMR